ncbi:MAG: hypothetical protein FJ265_07360 [Planctomycetes bacterium]|nr:hypothetical protein [Planctomycetota bacterium]
MRVFRTAVSLVLAFTLGAVASAAGAQQPLELGFEVGEAGGLPADWFVGTEGWTARLTETRATAGKRSLELAPGEGAAEAGSVMRWLPADGWANLSVRLSARVQVVGGGRAQMWLRVDNKDGSMGALDNMAGRAIVAGDWQDATVEVDVTADAQALAFGFLAFDRATVFVDDVVLRPAGRARPVQGPTPPAPLSPRGLQNVAAASRLLGYLRFFHPAKALVDLKAWDHFAVALVEVAEPAADAADLAQRLQSFVRPFAPTVQVWAGGAEAVPPAVPMPEGATHRWSWLHQGAGTVSGHRGVYQSRMEKKVLRAGEAAAGGPDDGVADLGGGVSCRVRHQVPGTAKATLPAAPLPDGWTPRELPVLTAAHRSTRLAAVALAWGVFQHFYPYFDVVDTDWAAALPEALTAAATDADASAFLHTLRRLVARLHDGHGHVGKAAAQPKDFLPVAVAWAGQELVVVGKCSEVGDAARIGDVVVAIDGRPVALCYEQLAQEISAATDGWRRHRSEGAFVEDLPTADPVLLELRHPDGALAEVKLPRRRERPADARPKRPGNGSELAPGIVYFDLDGAANAALDAALPALQAAAGIVFDMRGYPDEAAVRVMELLLTEAGTSARWIVPDVRKPDRQEVEWRESGRWRLRPRKPHLAAKIAFLTDGRAISYAESIMGVVETYAFGAIVGAPTAGTNGNVNPFELPGGFTVSWTGMKVLKHDGGRHHGVGIAPTVPVVPTAAGIAAGRDEVLERAVATLQQQLGR